MHCGKVVAAIVLQAVGLEECLDSGSELNKPVLGHGREQVVFNLEVEVTHPPVGEPMRGDVDGVVSSVLSPVDVLILVENGKVCVREGKVGEDIGTTEGH